MPWVQRSTRPCQRGPDMLTRKLPSPSSYLQAIGRFLIVVTFLEDALRIMTQWSEQLLYLHDYRKSMAQLSVATRQNPQ